MDTKIKLKCNNWELLFIDTTRKMVGLSIHVLNLNPNDNLAVEHYLFTQGKLIMDYLFNEGFINKETDNTPNVPWGIKYNVIFPI